MDKTEDKRKAGKIGGARRAEILPPDRRAEIARKAAAARWDRVYNAVHKGNFKEEFGTDIDCYVLDDPGKTAVISQRGMGEAIGFSRRGSRLKVFVASQTMEEYIGRELREKIENPLVFQPAGATAAGAGVSARAYGYDATVLIDLCRAIQVAKNAGKLSGPRYDKMVAQADIIIGASAKLGIRDLVYALAGYSPTTDEVIAAFKVYVQEEAKKYEPEFPSELYMQWYRLYGIPVPERGKPWHFKYLTVNHIYYPLAKSSGKLLELLRAHKASGGDRAKKLFQFLNDIGTRALRMHLGRVLEMAESSPDRYSYERKIVQRFGGQQEFDFIVPPPKADTAAAKSDGPLFEHTEAKESAS